jgi:serine-threonine kinase receptor-associated protein
VFDIRSGQEVTTMQTGAEVTSIEVSFDGNYITSTDGKSVKFWSTSNLQQLKEFTLPYTVESASFCPAKRRFVAGGDDMWVRLYNAETGAELEVLKGHHGPVHTVRFGPEGKEYASGSEDGTIRIWQTDYLSEEAPESNGAA